MSAALLFLFDIRAILNFMKLRIGLDKQALPYPTLPYLVLTRDNEVQEESQSVWKDITDRPLEAARTLAKRDGTWRSPKCLKSVHGNEVHRAGTSCKGNDADDELAALLTVGVTDEDVLERPDNEEVQCFQKDPLKKKDFPLNIRP